MNTCYCFPKNRKSLKNIVFTIVLTGLGLQNLSKNLRFPIKCPSKILLNFEHVFFLIFTLLGIDFGSILESFLSSWEQLGSFGSPRGNLGSPVSLLGSPLALFCRILVDFDLQDLVLEMIFYNFLTKISIIFVQKQVQPPNPPSIQYWDGGMRGAFE